MKSPSQWHHSQQHLSPSCRTSRTKQPQPRWPRALPRKRPAAAAAHPGGAAAAAAAARPGGAAAVAARPAAAVAVVPLATGGSVVRATGATPTLRSLSCIAGNMQTPPTPAPTSFPFHHNLCLFFDVAVLIRLPPSAPHHPETMLTLLPIWPWCRHCRPLERAWLWFHQARRRRRGRLLPLQRHH